MAITYFNSTSNPADAGTLAAATVSITPPGSMLAGDLVLMIGTQRAAGITITVVETSGQTWNALASVNGTTNGTLRIFWARFNGAWGADPSCLFTNTANTSIVMHVFRPTTGSNTWDIDQAQVELDFTAVNSVTITGQNTTQASTVTLASWITGDDNTWGNLTGTGWVVTGLAQYRNVAGSDESSTYAHKIQTSAGATGNVSKDQLTLGGDAGTTSIVTFYEIAAVASIPNKIKNINQSVNRSNTY